jgi:hypothetical protein
LDEPESATFSERLETHGVEFLNAQNYGVKSRGCENCFIMGLSSTTPSLVPEFDGTVYFVLDDYGNAGRVYREADEEEGRLEAVIDNLFTGQYNKPVRVIAFNIAEGWARNVSEDIARELLRRKQKEGRPLPAPTRGFVEFHVGKKEAF